MIQRDLISYDPDFRRLHELRRTLTKEEEEQLGKKGVKDRENQRIWEGTKYRCVNDRLSSLREEILRRLDPRDEYQGFLFGMNRDYPAEIRSPRGSNKILISGGRAKSLTSIFTITINPDWTAELWVRNLGDSQGSPIRRQYKVEFQK